MRYISQLFKIASVINIIFTLDMETHALGSWHSIRAFKIFQELVKSESHLTKKICFICLNEDPLKTMKNAFYFILKALFVLKIIKFLLLAFLVRLEQGILYIDTYKTPWLERWSQFQNLWRHNLVNKELQYTYCPIFHQAKATRELNLAR